MLNEKELKKRFEEVWNDEKENVKTAAFGIFLQGMIYGASVAIDRKV